MVHCYRTAGHFKDFQSSKCHGHNYAIVTSVSFNRLFFNMRFQMLAQIVCTKVAGVLLFSAVCFQVSPQIARLSRSKVKFVAFI